MSAYVTRSMKRQLLHNRLQEADRVVDAYETAEKRILSLQDKLGASEQLRRRLAHCQEQLVVARRDQDLAWAAWELGEQ